MKEMYSQMWEEIEDEPVVFFKKSLSRRVILLREELHDFLHCLHFHYILICLLLFRPHSGEKVIKKSQDDDDDGGRHCLRNIFLRGSCLFANEDTQQR